MVFPPPRERILHFLQSCLVAAVLSVLHQPASAQIGDKAGEEQKSLVAPGDIPPAPSLSPEEALKSFRLAPGLRLELVASEPLVEDPVAMVFSPDGRLWVVEMRGYMTDFNGSTEDQPVGRIAVLTDADHDGRYDQRSVFLDGLILPRAIALVGDGVLVGAPPWLKFWRDTDGDGKADQETVVASDYGVQTDPKHPEQGNPERAPNSLLWAADNWIYSTAYTKKFRYRRGQWETGLTSFRGQWGLSQDDFGRLFHNSNSDPLRADVVDSSYLVRNPNFPRLAGSNVKVADNFLVWPIRVTPGTNRAYRPETMHNGKLKEFTAACAPLVYRGDLLPPEFYGNAFIAEPTANLVKRTLITAANGTLSSHEAYEQSEFLASTDERFRPVNLNTGPDGALYIVDFQRGVLQHRISLTTYLRKQSEDRDLIAPIHKGRIYRVVPADRPTPAAPRLPANAPAAQWLPYVSHANSWWRETAQRVLVERGDGAIAPPLRDIALKGSSAFGRATALRVLDGLDQLDAATVAGALRDAEPVVRTTAVRLAERFLAGKDSRQAMVEKLLALRNDASPEVQLQLVATLTEVPDLELDVKLAAMVRADPKNVFLDDVFYSGLFNRELPLLERLLADPQWPADEPAANRLVAGLAKGLMTSRRPENAARLLALIAAQPETAVARRKALLEGALEAAPVISRRPLKFAAEPPGLTELKRRIAPGEGERLVQLERLLTWPGKPGAETEQAVPALTATERVSFEAGAALYAGSCVACHQPNGRGLAGLAPPLADSEWVNGSAGRMIRIALQGVHGPIMVDGTIYRLEMPGFAIFSDDQLSSILTYVRRSWGNTGTPVAPEQVAAIRKQTAGAGRKEAWTQAELLQIP